MHQRPRYWGFIADSSRWDDFVHRPDDIVISTPSKSGTTWMQRLVALLLFDGPDFPAPLNEMSLWLDINLRSPSQTRALLEAQQHRRFIKTHVPLDGLPLDDRVTYLVVGRDPRDVFVSMEHHLVNMDEPRTMQLRKDAIGDQDLATLPQAGWPETVQERWRFAMDLARGSNHASHHLALVLHHLDAAWQRRHQPNVHLFHYLDLKADLPGQLGRLARVLDIELAPGRARELAAEASLERMRETAAQNTPTAQTGSFLDPARFFRTGGSGEWRDLCQPGDEEHYAARVAELVEPELAHWAHHGGPVPSGG